MTIPRSPSTRPRSSDPEPGPRTARALRSHRAGRSGTVLYVPQEEARGLRRRGRAGGTLGRRPGRLNVAVTVTVVLALLLTVADRAAGRVWAFLDFGAGVLALVSLSATTLWGLGASDRLLLGPDHRVLAQGVHRGLAVAGLGFLALHIWVKIATGSTDGTAAAVPFTDGFRPVLIGLGTLSGYLFLAVAITGAARSAFATPRRSRWWRALHMGAYLAWSMALVHGLKSGRAAAGWATGAYVLSLLGVAAVLALRLVPRKGPEATGGTPIDRRKT